MSSGRFEFHQLRCFVAVAKELNFRRAAERMNMTQPPLSRQIQLLEHGLGLKLLERSNRNVRLTSAGESFLASAGDLLQRAEYAVFKACQAERGEAGAIEMGFVPSAALEFIPRVIEAMSRQLPAVQFHSTEMMSYEILEALRTARLDFGLSRAPVKDGEVETNRIVSETFVLAMPADHPLAQMSEVSLLDLNEVAFIGYSAERGGFLRAVHSSLFTMTRVSPDVVQEVSQTHTLLALVNQGIGVALVPESSQALHMSNLAYRPIKVPPEFRSDLYLVSRSGEQSALVQRAREVILDAFDV